MGELDQNLLLDLADNATIFENAIESLSGSRSLGEFTRGAFPIMEPGRPYRSNWLQDALDEHLEACYDRDIKRLLINVPPGMMKSLKSRVFFPTWVWTMSPQERFLGASYSHHLAIRDNRKARQVIESPWYQTLWGDVCRLSADSTAKHRFENTEKGFMFATTIKGTTTGERGNYLMIDDPNNPKTAESDAVREEVLFWFAEVAPSRLIDQNEDVIVVIQQRVHEQDVTGFAIEADLDYEHLCIPMEFEDYRPATSIGWTDPRTEVGELCSPETMNAEAVTRLKKQLASWGGDYAIAGQLQQRPAPRGGGMFKKDKVNYLDSVPEGTSFVRGWDLAATKDGGAFTCGGLLGIDPTGRVVLADMQRAQLSPDSVEELIEATARADSNSIPISIPQDPGQAGIAQKSSYIKRLQGFDVEFTPESGDKATRAAPLAAQVNAGNFYLVRGEWNRQFVSEMGSFPVGRYADQIDATSRAYSLLLRSHSGGRFSIGGGEQESKWKGK
jgi:predicted phage terminase large subunit-like protein